MYNTTMILQKVFKALLALLIVGFGITYIDREIAVPQPIVRVAKSVDPRQLLCMAENIFHEAGSEGLMGQAAVARVVLNRIKHGFASTPCDVVHQKTVVQTGDGDDKVICQFSWTCENKTVPHAKDPRFQSSKAVAYQVLAYDAYRDVVPSSTLFFHNKTVEPNWPYHRVAEIDNHVFYSKKRVKKNEQSSKRP